MYTKYIEIVLIFLQATKIQILTFLHERYLDLSALDVRWWQGTQLRYRKFSASDVLLG